MAKRLIPIIVAVALPVSAFASMREVPIPRPRPALPAAKAQRTVLPAAITMPKLPGMLTRHTLASAPAVHPMPAPVPAATETQSRPLDALPQIWAPPMEAFAADPDPTEVVPAAAPEPSACQLRVAEKLAIISPLPPFAGPGDCRATDVVRLDAVLLNDKTRVALTPAAVVRCPLAEAFANWVRDDVAAAVTAMGTGLRSIDNYSSYDCRGRNRAIGARLSEHGLANAIDIKGVALTNGSFAGLTERALSKEFRETVKKSTCERFTTVLGPGSDGHHETHVHLDLAERKGGYRLCQWDVRDPLPEAPPAVPLPMARPPGAPGAPQQAAAAD